MNLNTVMVIGGAMVALLGIFGKKGLMDKHKKKLDELATAAVYAKDSDTIALIQLHASLVVGDLLVDVKAIGRDIYHRLNDWDQEFTTTNHAGELTKIRELLEKMMPPDDTSPAEETKDPTP